ANIIFGTVIDDSLGDEVRVTVIAAGFDSGTPPHKKLEPTKVGGKATDDAGQVTEGRVVDGRVETESAPTAEHRVGPAGTASPSASEPERPAVQERTTGQDRWENRERAAAPGED